MVKSVVAEKADVKWRIEAHIWFEGFAEYARRYDELTEFLGRIRGNGSVIIFFRSTPEYIEIPGASYDYNDESAVEKLMDFCGVDNVDFVARLSLNKREQGFLRWGEDTA